MMPRYDENIDANEISSAIGANRVQMNELSRALDQVRSRLDQMSTIMQKQRDYTREEIREMQAFRREVEGVAEAERRRDADRVKGMSSYSVYMERIERQIEDYKSSALEAEAKIRQAREQNAKLEQSRQGRFSKDKNEQMRLELKSTETNGAKLKKMAQERIDANKKIISQSEQIRNESRKQVTTLDEQYKKSIKIKDVAEERADKMRRTRGISALEVASDLHLPGISNLATIAKYTQRGVQGAQEDGAGGFGQFMGGGLGLMRGLGIAAGGFTALQGYRAYRTAHEMAPLARTLGGQMGPGSVGARQQAITAYGGYGGVENLQLLTQLNRALGGQAGIQNLRGTTDIANRFGLGREEVAGQLGGAFMAGMSPGTAARDMEKIMSEGVKAGMDRARITQFTQEVLSVQQELFRTTGENNAQAIAEAMGQLMRASGQGEQFLRGPAAQGVRGLNQAVMAAGRGQLQGQGAATLFRAFGFGAGGAGGGVEDYYNARRRMEGGIFGQGLGGDAVKNIGSIIGRYDTETGGNQKAANLRMADELGIGINQIESLRTIQAKAAQGQPLSKEDMKALQKIQEETKDPMIRLLDVNAKMNENLARLAGSEGGIDAVLSIDRAILKAQEQAVGFLQSIANALTGNTGGGMGDYLTAGAGILGLGAMIAPKTAGTIMKGAGKGLGRGAGALARGAGAGAAALAPWALPALGVAGAGAAGYGVGMGLNWGADQLTTEENQYGQKSNIFERGIGRVMSMLPESMGGITGKQYQDMYGASPENAFRDPDNTAATEKNTEALIKLNENISRMRMNRANVGGSYK